MKFLGYHACWIHWLELWFCRNFIETAVFRIYVALITPLRSGTFDEPAFREIVEWHISEGTDGLVPCGTAVNLNTEP